jgi:WSC domain
MLQVLNSLAVAVALYPILVASSMHKVRHSPDLAVRSPAIPSVIEVGKRQDSSIPYSYSLIGCVDEIDNWPVRVLTQQYVDWDGESPSSCINGCWNTGPIDGPFGPHNIFAGVVNGDQCWCDITINVNAQTVDQDRCDHTCVNGSEYNCGGSREYLMYALGEIYGVLILLLLIDNHKIKRISIHSPPTRASFP